MSNNEKLKALKLTIDKIDKDFGKGSVMMMNEKGEQALEVVSTGSIGLDSALGVGGLPRGRPRRRAAACGSGRVPRITARPTADRPPPARARAAGGTELRDRRQ